MEPNTTLILAAVVIVALMIFLILDYFKSKALKEDLERKVQESPYRLIRKVDGTLKILAASVFQLHRCQPSIIWFDTQWEFPPGDESKATVFLKKLETWKKENKREEVVWPPGGVLYD